MSHSAIDRDLAVALCLLTRLGLERELEELLVGRVLVDAHKVVADHGHAHKVVTLLLVLLNLANDHRLLPPLDKVHEWLSVLD